MNLVQAHRPVAAPLCMVALLISSSLGAHAEPQEDIDDIVEDISTVVGMAAEGTLINWVRENAQAASMCGRYYYSGDPGELAACNAWGRATLYDDDCVMQHYYDDTFPEPTRPMACNSGNGLEACWQPVLSEDGYEDGCVYWNRLPDYAQAFAAARIESLEATINQQIENGTATASATVATFQGTVGSATADHDMDGVPDSLEPEICARSIVEQALDELEEAGSCQNSTDYVPKTHEAAIPVPTGFTLGPDADGDGIPAWISVDGTLVTFSNDAGNTTKTAPWSSGPATIDPNDDDRENPVPWGDIEAALQLANETVVLLQETAQDAINEFDSDGDLIIDEFEPLICLVEDRNDPIDGSCEGQDYTP